MAALIRLLLALLLPLPVWAQAPVPCRWQPLSGLRYELSRFESDAKSELLRRPSGTGSCSDSATFRIGPAGVESHSAFNSSFPRDRNNGMLWAGRGYAASITAGVQLQWGRFRAALAPAFAYQQNREFAFRGIELPGYSPFMNANHPAMIDWPQRFGDRSFDLVDAGQSFVRFDTRSFSIGVSHENLWLGPALHYPLLLSNTAGGFPHAFVGWRSGATRLGHFDVDVWLGRLDESPYFDATEANDRRVLHGAALSWQPVRDLYFGLARLYTQREPGATPADILLRPLGFARNALSSVEDNQLFSLQARYVLRKERAEVYLEWAHEVGYDNLRELVTEPDQTQAYTLGINKMTRVGNHQLRVYGEATHLQSPTVFRSGKGPVSYYTHGTIRQGHTHGGQLLGSWIGPGSDAQIVGADVVWRSASLGLYAERVRFDDDAYYDQWSKYYAHNAHDAQLSGGIRASVRTGAIGMSVDAGLTKRHNRVFRLLDGSQPPRLTVEKNEFVELSFGWYPPLRSGQ